MLFATRKIYLLRNTMEESIIIFEQAKSLLGHTEELMLELVQFLSYQKILHILLDASYQLKMRRHFSARHS